MQRYLYEHFQHPGHTNFLENTFVTFIHNTDPRAPTEREYYWIHTIKTKASLEPNVDGGYWTSILYSYYTTVSFPGFGRLVLALVSDYSDYCYTYFV